MDTKPLTLPRLEISLNDVEVENENTGWVTVNNLFDIRITREKCIDGVRVRITLFTFDLSKRVGELIVDEKEFTNLWKPNRKSL